MARDWLKTLRIEKFPSQSALARAAGIAPARYSRIELGYSELRGEEAQALAGALEKPVDFILTGKLKPQAQPAKPVAVTSLPEPLPPAAAPAKSAVPVPPEPPKGLAAATAAPPPAPIAEEKAGDDLSDPANFTLLPPADALSAGNLAPAAFRARLQQHAAFATKVLHTSKVKPRIWTAWRDFGREVDKTLRGAVTASPATIMATSVAVIPPPPPRPTEEQGTPRPAPLPTRRSKQNKNLFGHFVDVARETLPGDQVASLNALATSAKEKEPEVGFMKHFNRAAKANLALPDYERIEAEAARRTSSTTSVPMRSQAPTHASLTETARSPLGAPLLAAQA